MSFAPSPSLLPLLLPLLPRKPLCRSHCPCCIVVSKRWAMGTAAAMVLCRSHCFHCHHPHHICLIGVSKRWGIAIAAAMTALRAMVLGDCDGSSSNDSSCRDSGGKDGSDGGNGLGDNRPCCLCHFPLCHPPHHCHCQCLCCHHCHCICCRPPHCPLHPHQSPLPMPSPSVSIALFVAVVNAIFDAAAITLGALAIALVVAAATALIDTRHLVVIAIVHVVMIAITCPPPLLL
jgi:hypothetical protein